MAQRYQQQVTVGWIAPMALELTPALAVLENYEQVATDDEMTYYVGKIGAHFVVVTVCPRIGTTQAASTVTHMRRSFPNIKHLFVVGIAGGVPTYGLDERQIVLGDVVIGYPQGSEGGIKHYEFGAWQGRTDFANSGHTLHPSDILLSAVNSLRAEHDLARTNIPNILSRLRAQLGGQQKRDFSDPGGKNDYLFPDRYLHQVEDKLCKVVCDLKKAVPRGSRGPTASRAPDSPQIHYGTIGSANALVMSSEKRDELYKKDQIICVEMESAGVMGSHQALVIRGICDYADSHKNKRWQKYAATTAAAYAKELLLTLPPAPHLSSHQDLVIREIYDYADSHKSKEWQKYAATAAAAYAKELLLTLTPAPHLISNRPRTTRYGDAPRPDQDAATLRRQNRILRSLKTSNYLAQKNRNPQRVQGTCEWFTAHEIFKTWEQSQCSSMLWVSADPGCGKSVLARHLVDDVLPKRAASRTICYFFFKEEFEDQRSARGALSCILHQLFMQRDFLLSGNIIRNFDASEQSLTFSELWDILITLSEVQDAGEIICIFDALDECDEGKDHLQQAIRGYYSTQRPSSNLKLLVTSRPYSEIHRDLLPLHIDGLPVIHLCGESEHEKEKISREIDIFIKYKVNWLRPALSDVEKCQLLQRLTNSPNRTYLWVYLTLDLIKEAIRSVEGKDHVLNGISSLPTTLDEAYGKILSKSADHAEARRLLHIVVSATRPLTLQEMQLALAVQEEHNSYSSLDGRLRSEKEFYESMRDFCGLFVTVVNKRIYLIHQTAKEFLVQSEQTTITLGPNDDPSWKHRFSPQESHALLANICIQHLLFREFEVDIEGKEYTFLDYSADNWATHLRLSRIQTDSLIESALNICERGSRPYWTWFQVYWRDMGSECPLGLTPLIIASYFGLTPVVRVLLKKRAFDINGQDATYGRTALSWAAGNGFDDAAELLIRGGSEKISVPESVPREVVNSFWRGAKIDSTDLGLRTPLTYAAWNGHVKVVKLLIRAGSVCVNTPDNINATPLHYAICGNHPAVVSLFQGTGLDLAAVRPGVLFAAFEKGQEPVIHQLIKTGNIDVSCTDEIGRTPLWYAARYGYEAIAKLIIATRGVDVNAQDRFGETPLLCAVRWGNEAIAKLLIATRNVDVDARDKDGWTPLLHGASEGHEAVVKLLIETGTVDVNVKNNNGCTPLLCAARGGHEAVVELLVQTGTVDVAVRDKGGWTPLLYAANAGYESVVKLLINTGTADVDVRDQFNQTPLLCAASGGHETIVKLLIATGNVDVDVKGENGWTPLLCAVFNRDDSMVELLLATGNVDVDSTSEDGYTPISLALELGLSSIARRLEAARPHSPIG